MNNDNIEEDQKPYNRLSETVKYNSFYIYCIAINASMGALLSGYVMGIFNVASDYLTTVVSPDITQRQIYYLTSVIPLGAGIGTLVGWRIVHQHSRVALMFITDVIALLGITCSHSFEDLYRGLIGRLVLGFCVGLNSTLVPIYLSEIAPGPIRGIIGTFFQLFFSIGLILSYSFGYLLPQNPTVNDDVGYKWEIIWAFPFLPALIRMWLLRRGQDYDSPRYLLEYDSQAAAEGVLKKIYTGHFANEQLNRLKRDLELEQHSFDSQNSQLQSKATKKRFKVGIILAVLPQLIGFNAIIFYSKSIFKQEIDNDDANSTAQLETMAIGCINLLSVIFATILINKIGRRKLLIFGSLLIFLVLSGFCTLSFIDEGKSKYLPYFLMAYSAVYGFSLGSVMWLYVSEILPARMISIAFTWNWFASFVVAESFPQIDQGYAFGVFALFSLFSVLFIVYFVPETQGKTDQEIRELFDTSRKTTNIAKILRSKSTGKA